MAFIKCPKCKRPISEQLRRCPGCGSPVGKGPIDAAPSNGRSTKLAAIVAIAVAGGLFALYSSGRLSLPAATPAPRPDLRPTAPAPADNAGKRFGLTEDERRQVYEDFVRAEDHAQVAADYRYPPLDTAASDERWQMHTEMREHFRKQVDDEDKNAIAKRYGLSGADLRAIAAEGTEKSWPRPGRQSIR